MIVLIVSFLSLQLVFANPAEFALDAQEDEMGIVDEAALYQDDMTLFVAEEQGQEEQAAEEPTTEEPVEETQNDDMAHLGPIAGDPVDIVDIVGESQDPDHPNNRDQSQNNDVAEEPVNNDNDTPRVEPQRPVERPTPAQTVRTGNAGLDEDIRENNTDGGKCDIHVIRTRSGYRYHIKSKKTNCQLYSKTTRKAYGFFNSAMSMHHTCERRMLGCSIVNGAADLVEGAVDTGASALRWLGEQRSEQPEWAQDAFGNH